MDQALKTLVLQRLKSSQYQSAIEQLNNQLIRQPNDTDALAFLGRAYRDNNQWDLAAESFEKALSIDPTHTAALCDYAEIKLAGPQYIEALTIFHQRIKPAYYVEVGVCKGTSFKLNSPETTAIGIDPEPQIDTSALPKKHSIIKDTSDNYFASGQLNAALDNNPIDLAFIDGMHLFEYALRDFINLEKHAHRDSVILVHDVYPMNSITAERERHADFWSGDVWKLFLCLQEHRPDLECIVLPCAPTGLGVITQLDPGSTTLTDKLTQITDKYIDLPFDTIEGANLQTLNIAKPDHPWLTATD